MKNLASAQVVKSIRSIDGADNIEVAELLGWQIVVKKGEFSAGDLVCYIQIDTCVPQIPMFEFLESRNYRVRTIKLRKVISQGLIVPLPLGSWMEGDDLTKVMGVTKYDKGSTGVEEIYDTPVKPKGFLLGMIHKFKYKYLYRWFPSLRKPSRTPFPTNLVSKTDEERIQNIPSVLDKYLGQKFILSYKLNGSSITIIHENSLQGSKYRICSRRFELHDKKNDFHAVFNSTQFELEIQKLVRFFGTNNIIVQGEAIGKFNGNYHNLSKGEIRLFNIIVDGKRIKQFTFVEVCERLRIPYCPVYKEVVMGHTLGEVIKMSEIKDILNPSVEAEGLVWRSYDGEVSFKVINNNFLIKNKE